MRKLLVFLVALLMVGMALAAPPTPTTLEIDCGNGFQTTPFNCDFLTKPQPQFRFNGTAGCNRYQVQVDSDSAISTPPWFWDSGTTTATCTATTTATFPSSTNGGSSANGPDDLPNDGIAAQSMWAGLRRFYWHVRVSADGGSTWSAYSTAASGGFSANTYPTLSEPLSVASGSGGGAVESYGTTGGTTRNATTATFASICASTVAGDTIALATGSYAGFSASTCGPVGTKAKPITITKQAGATPTITGTLTLDRAFWTIDGLTFTNSSSCSLRYSAANLIVRNSTFTGAGTCSGNDDSVMFIGGNPSNYFVNNTVNIAGAPYNVIAPLPSTDKVIRGNDMQAAGSRAIKKTGTQTTMGGNITLADNNIHNFSGGDGGLTLAFYYGSGELYMARNVIRDGSGGSSYNMQFLRGAWPQMRNLTLGREGGTNLYCVQFDDQDGQPVLDNVYCTSTSIAFAMSGQNWDTTKKYQLRNSVIRWNGNGSSAPTRTDNTADCGSTGTSCFDFTNVVWGATNVLDASLRPTTCNSATCNLGIAGQAIPTGATAPIDIGRFEWGATTGTATSSTSGVYDYQSQWTVNTTPRISWTFVDGDNALHSAGQIQGAYEVQVDPTTYFDSRGDWKPYCSSGIVSSASAFWDVPSGCALATGTKYYFRVRTWDNVATATTSNAGIWSDYINAFTTTGGGGPVCGNASVETPEVCDGTNLNGQDCVSRGFSGGTLSCSSDCLSFDTSLCSIATTTNSRLFGVKISGGAAH